ncbi:hypothetical protein [Mucilaginibacter sp. L3T2-6]|uniref:hypothetical protein n=1 Tax=Mucilaginibacter sp. L3T2-6 TaxID=3062491 RepID=UPI0026775E30|nr:hypothetical protein [Mucilaginibacter sp. L3T2-6]MDO3643312.1 hypothetical protein [Mucilaginibacter sp. L3T2-6]MDV6215755.1 hypothetical protein [Mucilaginibacter sp. L3T2-6]
MKIFLTAALMLSVCICFAQQQSDFKVYNRSLSINKAGNADVIYLNDRNSAGIAWLKDVKFTDGNIECDIKGRDMLQRSFVGIAFHGVNDTTYDCIYFRPFNFNASDKVRRSHSVQYVSEPKYDWEILRNRFPNKYEQSLQTPPGANDWFHVLIHIKDKTVKVYVNNERTPSLTVEQIQPMNGTMLGYWAGYGSDGSWKNLKISK